MNWTELISRKLWKISKSAVVSVRFPNLGNPIFVYDLWLKSAKGCVIKAWHLSTYSSETKELAVVSNYMDGEELATVFYWSFHGPLLTSFWREKVESKDKQGVLLLFSISQNCMEDSENVELAIKINPIASLGALFNRFNLSVLPFTYFLVILIFHLQSNHYYSTGKSGL